MIFGLMLLFSFSVLAGEQEQEVMVGPPAQGISQQEIEAFRALPYGPEVYRGAEVLSLEPAYVAGIQEGLNLLYARKYDEVHGYFTDLDARYPGTPLTGVGDVLVWQTRMLENFDYQFDEAYWKSSAASRSALKAALKEEGNQAWEHFLMGGIVGIEAIHYVRHERYIKALDAAFSAITEIQRSRDLAPDFIDFQLADGMYNFWRTVLAKRSKLIPDFGDHRSEGLEQMVHVENAGTFLSAPATLALTFSWLQERKMRKATQSLLRNKRHYPDNVINNLLLEETWTRLKQYKQALRVQDEILRISPTNRQVLYDRGMTYTKMGEIEKARSAFNSYLGSSYLEESQRASAYFRLGRLAARERNWELAKTHYQRAVKINGHRASKASLERLKKKKATAP